MRFDELGFWRTYLVFCVQRHNAGFMCADNRLARAHYTRACFALQFVRRQQQQKTALQEVDPEEERHEAEIRVVFQNVCRSFRRADRVPHRRDERLGRDPEVVVVQEIDRIPLASQQNVKDMHDVRPVGDHHLRMHD